MLTVCHFAGSASPTFFILRRHGLSRIEKYTSNRHSSVRLGVYFDVYVSIFVVVR